MLGETAIAPATARPSTPATPPVPESRGRATEWRGEGGIIVKISTSSRLRPAPPDRSRIASPLPCIMEPLATRQA